MALPPRTAPLASPLAFRAASACVFARTAPQRKEQSECAVRRTSEQSTYTRGASTVHVHVGAATASRKEPRKQAEGRRLKAARARPNARGTNKQESEYLIRRTRRPWRRCCFPVPTSTVYSAGLAEGKRARQNCLLLIELRLWAASFADCLLAPLRRDATPEGPALALKWARCLHLPFGNECAVIGWAAEERAGSECNSCLDGN